ncbi:MAG: glucokinase, partial [Nanoarchaeota archaeon]
MKYILAADIGGTYTRVALYTPAGVRRVYHRFENVRYPSVTALFHDFRVRHAVPLSRASVAVAGPVHEGDAKMPNLAWHVSEELLKHALLVKDVRLHNDAYAAAVGLGSVPIMKVKDGRADPKGPRAILAPGTGLGSSYTIWDGKKHIAHPAEAGHADFAPVTETHAHLREFLKGRFAHVSNERVMSGPGLVAIYYFLREQKAASESDAQRRAIDSAYSPAQAIV